MDKEKRNKLMWRWSIASAALIGTFWLVYYLVTGEMPVVNSFQMTENWIVELPFGIPRYMDLFFCPLFSCAFIPLVFITFIDDGEQAYGSAAYVLAAFGLLIGLAYGLALGFVFGMALGLAFVLAYGLVFGLVFGLGWVLKTLFLARMWRGIGMWLAGK